MHLVVDRASVRLNSEPVLGAEPIVRTVVPLCPRPDLLTSPMTLITKGTNLLGDADGELFMRVIRVTADLTVPDLDEAKAFYKDFLGLDAQDMGLAWVTRVVVPSSGEHIQLLSQDATGPENPLLSVKVDDVDEAYAIAQRLGYEIVHPLTTEPWGIRRFFVRAPGGTVLNIAQHHDPNE